MTERVNALEIELSQSREESSSAQAGCQDYRTQLQEAVLKLQRLEREEAQSTDLLSVSHKPKAC